MGNNGMRFHSVITVLMVVLVLLAGVFGLPLESQAAPLPTDPPVIGTDHPTQPGEVMLFKKAEAIDGLVNTWQVTLRVEAMDTTQTSDTILVIDTSGSMRENGRMTAAIAAATTLIEDLLPETTPVVPLNRIAVISFDSYAYLETAFTSSRADAIAAVSGLNAGGGTFTQDAVRDARNLMGGSIADHKNIILLSDGEPTFSYGFTSVAVRRAGYVEVGRNYQTGTAYTANSYGTGRVGGGTAMTTWVERYNTRNSYYNHGNSAIAEAGFAKNAGSTLYTIALEAGTSGTNVLRNMASTGKNYTATPANLSTIFREIAGQINSAVRDARVSDPMGTGFEVNGTVEDISVTQGTATYTDNRINWLIGTLTEPIAVGSNVKYAEMTYQVTINDGILDVASPDGKFNTNDGASLTYTYTDSATGEDVTTTVTFPEPSENPVLLVMEKVLIDSLGETVLTTQAGADNRRFNLNVINDDNTYNYNYLLYAGQRRVMTNLRLEEFYTVNETAVQGNPGSALGDDYTTAYEIVGTKIDGTIVPVTGTTFYVGNDGTDFDITVTNTEKRLGKLTVTKVFIPQAEGGTAATGAAVDGLSFPFTVSGPTGPNFPNNTHIFSLKPGESMVLENLPYGEYTVLETDTLGFLATYADNDAPPASTTDGKVTLAINAKERTVTVTNRPTATDEKTEVTGRKVWVNGPTETHTGVPMNLLADDVILNPQPPYTVTQTSGIPNSFTYTWTNLPKYNQSAQPISYTIEERDTIADYVVTRSEDGLTITNTYYQGVAQDFRATKVWSNGPALKETVWFRLYRTYTSTGGAEVTEAVPYDVAPLRELTGGTVGGATPPATTALWTGLPAPCAWWRGLHLFRTGSERRRQ